MIKSLNNKGLKLKRGDKTIQVSSILNPDAQESRGYARCKQRGADDIIDSLASGYNFQNLIVRESLWS